MTVDVTDFSVSTGGADRSDHTTSARITQEIPSAGVTGHLGAAGGILSSTAELALTDPELISEKRRSPWQRTNNWPPRDGDAVSVDTIFNGNTSRRFTGVTENADGAALNDRITLRAVSSVDQLHRRFTHDPLARLMPIPTTNSKHSDHIIADTWLRPEYFVDLAMRSCGYYTTPQGSTVGGLRVPMQGSVLPASGRLLECAPGQTGRWGPTSWGMGLRGPTIVWAPASTYSMTNFNVAFFASPGASITDSHGVYVDLLTSTDVRAVRVLASFTTSTTRIRVAFNNSATYVVNVTAPRDDSKIIRVRRSSTTLTVFYGVDQIYTGTPSVTANTVTKVRASRLGEGAQLGSLYLDSSGLGYLNAPNAFLRTGSRLLFHTLPAAPYISGTALELLQDITQALLASMWFDREDRLWWAHSDWLAGQAPKATLTADADVLDLAWRQSMDDTARQVLLRCRAAAVTGSTKPNVELWRGRVEVLSSTGEQVELWATPDSDVSWIDVDDILAWVGTNNQGSEAAATIVDTVANTDRSDSTSATWTSTQVTSQALKIGYTAPTLTANEEVHLRTRRDRFAAGSPYEYLNNQPMPVIRGYGKIEWTDMEHSSAANGPAWARELVHDVGPWVQGAQCQELADWLMGELATSRPVISNLEVAYRDDVALGDVVTIQEDAVYKATLTALVIGVRESHAASDTQVTSQLSLSLRVLSYTTA